MIVSSFRDQFMRDDAGHRELVQIVMSLGFGLRLGLWSSGRPLPLSPSPGTG